MAPFCESAQTPCVNKHREQMAMILDGDKPYIFIYEMLRDMSKPKLSIGQSNTAVYKAMSDEENQATIYLLLHAIEPRMFASVVKETVSADLST